MEFMTSVVLYWFPVTWSRMNEVHKSYDLKCPKIEPEVDGEQEAGKWGSNLYTLAVSANSGWS